jgi:AcrR family transcriptional regulator
MVTSGRSLCNTLYGEGGHVPKYVDHDLRRRQLAEALWRIASREGLSAATVRQVAAEAGVSVGHVQHYFTTKDEMLQFALERLGTDLEARLVRKISDLPPPPDPYAVIWIVMRERLPLTKQRRAQTQVMVAWLGRVALRPDINEYVVAGTHRMREFLAQQLRLGKDRGEVPAHVDPQTAAEGLLAINEGLAAQLVTNLHTPSSALRVLAEYLSYLFPDHPRLA